MPPRVCQLDSSCLCTVLALHTIRIDDLRVCSVHNSHRSGFQTSIAHFLCVGKRNLLDDRRFVQPSACRRGTGVLDEEHLIGWWIPNRDRRSAPVHKSLAVSRQVSSLPCDCLVEYGVRVRGGDQGQGRVAANHIVELVVVDVERLGCQGFLSDTRPYEHLKYD